jgi:hypothetical protein
VLCASDPSDNVLKYCIKHKIDYIDITKPTSELAAAYALAKSQQIDSKIVFSSGWMSGITPLLLFYTGILPKDVNSVKIIIYFSTKDKAGKSSADFMAENVSKPFFYYLENLQKRTKHFLNAEDNVFRFDNKKRMVTDMDIPDLFVLNQIEKIPNVRAKITFNYKIVSKALMFMQKTYLFKTMMLWERKLIFGGGGKGDISSFEIIYSDYNQKESKIALTSLKGQSELTSFSTVLHIEKILQNDNPNGIYFAHQLHDPVRFITSLTSNKSILIQ